MIIESEQSRDIPLTQLVRGPFVIRYASYRKSEDAALNLRSEDLIMSELTARRLAFGLCDGVGSSFYGNIGSQILAEAILDWARDYPSPEAKDLADLGAWTDRLNADLSARLNFETEFATTIVQSKELDDAPPLVRIAEQTQRDDFGTQSNFAAGIIWPKSSAVPDGLVILFWLGNARLRIFSNEVELTHMLGWGKNPDQLKEVWSSKEGVIGTVYSYVADLSEITTIIAYSDGLEGTEEQIHPNMNDIQLESMVNLAQSIKDDDVSFLEISVSNSKTTENADDILEVLRDHYGSASPRSQQVNPQPPDTDISSRLEIEAGNHRRTKQAFAVVAVLSAVLIIFLFFALCVLGVLLIPFIGPAILSI